MSLLAQLLVAWFGINLLILALMWHNANERRRRLEAYELQRQGAPRDDGQQAWPTRGAATSAEGPAPETSTPAAEPPRVVVMVNGDMPARRLRQSPAALQPAPMPSTAPARCHCDCNLLRTEIRNLRLTVAELSIDRASLLAKLQPRQLPRAQPSQRSAAARS